MERPQAEWHWCEHEDCLESLEAFPTQQALHLHTQAVHATTATRLASQSSRHGGGVGHLVEARVRCAPGALEPEPEPEPEPELLPRLVIAPGNGCINIDKANWYRQAADEFRDTGWFSEVVCRTFPDAYRAREKIWVPFLQQQCACDANTIVIGHSSGAVACLRLLESTRLGGAVLVSACHTDLGDASERAAGYYSRPWQWNKIRANSDWIIQFHSTDDPFIPAEEARHVAKSLQLHTHRPNDEHGGDGDSVSTLPPPALAGGYYEYDNRSHFFRAFDELIQVVGMKLGKL